MAYALSGVPAFGGLRGLHGLGGTFAPDCYIAKGGVDTLAAPLTASELAGFRTTYGAARVDPVAAICNQSASPRRCMGQNFLAGDFLGSGCKAEWQAWVGQKMAAQAAGAPLPAAPAYETEPDNTMLYVGAAALALVAVGGAVWLGKKR